MAWEESVWERKRGGKSCPLPPEVVPGTGLRGLIADGERRMQRRESVLQKGISRGMVAQDLPCGSSREWWVGGLERLVVGGGRRGGLGCHRERIYRRR